MVEQVFSLLADGLMLAVIISGVPLLIVMAVGLFSSVLQAATQVQEQTLSYVPKIVTLALVCLIAGPLACEQLVSFLQGIFQVLIES